MNLSTYSTRDAASQQENLQQHHLQEWVQGSGVSEGITRLNVTSLSSQKEIAKALGLDYYTWEPGWVVTSVHPTSGLQRSSIAQFKPDRPYQPKDRSKKPTKYLSPREEMRAIFLDTGDTAYWPNIVKDTRQPVLITEGAKKAGAALTLGYPTIALLGVWNWVEQVDADLHPNQKWLIQDLKHFAVDGREIILAFDSDMLVKEPVQKALIALAKELITFGCNVRVLQLPPEHKGLDDFIVACGADDFRELVNEAPDFVTWKHQIESVKRQRFTDMIITELRLIWENAPDEMSRNLERKRLRKEYDLQPAELDRLEAYLQQEQDRAENRELLRNEVTNLVEISQYELRSRDFLPPELAQPIEAIAQQMGSPEAAFITTLLPVAGSLLAPGTEIDTGSFKQPPIIYSGVVAGSGSKKSPTQKVITKPLTQYLQGEANRIYERRLESFQAAEANWKKSKDGSLPPEKPIPREYYTADATREGLVQMLSQDQEHGLLIYSEELNGFFQGQNQYRGGKGADVEAFLSFFDNTGTKVNRANGTRIATNHSSVNITGSIQPGVLRSAMGDMQDTNGLWSRFLWCNYTLKKGQFINTFDMTPALIDLYQTLETFKSQTYQLAPEASQEYERFYDVLDNKTRDRSIAPGLQNVYAKMQGYTVRIALILHCIEAAIVGKKQPPTQISATTLRKAIGLVRYYIGQVKLIHTTGDALLYKELIDLSQDMGCVTLADAKKYSLLLRDLSGDTIRGYFRELEAMGFGTTLGRGIHLCWDVRGDHAEFDATADLSTTQIPSFVPEEVPPVIESAAGLEEVIDPELQEDPEFQAWLEEALLDEEADEPAQTELPMDIDNNVDIHVSATTWDVYEPGDSVENAVEDDESAEQSLMDNDKEIEVEADKSIDNSDKPRPTSPYANFDLNAYQEWLIRDLKGRITPQNDLEIRLLTQQIYLQKYTQEQAREIFKNYPLPMKVLIKQNLHPDDAKRIKTLL